jgi:hypothetical protein
MLPYVFYLATIKNNATPVTLCDEVYFIVRLLRLDASE